MRTATAPRTRRASTNLVELVADVDAAMKRLRDVLQPQDGTQIDDDVCTVEMYLAIAHRILAKTNPSKVRSEAVTVEIQARMSGAPESRRPPLGGSR